MVQKFGKYRLLQRIAVGGMAEIFVARRSGMEGFRKTIVIKRIRPHLSEQESFIRMFLDEARLAAQLNHSNIAQIFDLGRIEDSFFIAMEYVYGKDMRAVIPKAEEVGIPFPLVYSLKIAASVCEGLYYAHRKTDEDGKPLNIVHRDVTPENIMVSFDGEVKILDFGIAKAETLTSNTRAGEIKGKLGYLSPEQVGGKILDHRSDLFSLGVVLFEWLTARKLFKGGSEIDVLRAVVEGKISPPSHFRDNIPKEVDTILMKTLERDRNKRYQTAWELQHDIYQFLSKQEFIPSNIHLSNFMRQLFADELSSKDQKTVLQEDERTFSDDHETMLVTPAELTEQNTAKEKSPRRKSRKNIRVSSEPVLLEKSKVAHKNSPLKDEFLDSNEERVSLAVDLEELTYARLSEIAQRNGMSVAQFVREVLSHYAKYL